MTFEFYDPQEKWPESESEFDICTDHLPATIMWKKEDGECPMCKLEAAIESARAKKLRGNSHGDGWCACLHHIFTELKKC